MTPRLAHIPTMSNAPQIAEVAALVGDPARANILVALLGGRALTATELAHAAGVSPQTTSGHLGKLFTARLVVLMKQGRHRYYRLAGPQVAHMLESIMNVALDGPPRFQPKSKLDDAMRHARTCYDHFAGVLGVGIADAMMARDFVVLGDEAGEVTPSGMEFLSRLGVDLRGRPRQTPGVLPAVPRLDRAPLAYRRRGRRGLRAALLRSEMDRTHRRQPRAEDHAGWAARAQGIFVAFDLKPAMSRVFGRATTKK